MAKSIKFKNDTYLDSTSIVHNKKYLYNELVDINDKLNRKLLYSGITTFTFNNLVYAKKTLTLNSSIIDFDILYIVIYENGYGTGNVIDVNSLLSNIVMRNRILTNKLNSYIAVTRRSNTQLEIHLENTLALSGSVNIMVEIKAYKI